MGYSAFPSCYGPAPYFGLVVPSGRSRGVITCLPCKSMEHLDIPSNVTSIGMSAFVGCSTLTAVSIPPSVSMVGQGAFEGYGTIPPEFT